MKSTDIVKCVVWEDGGAAIMARIKGNSAANITQASLSAITCVVYSRAGDTPDEYTYTSVLTPTITVASTVYDTLQTDARWSADSTGYNFRHDTPATAFPTGDVTYRIVYTFDPVSGENFYLVVEPYAQDLP